VRTLAELEWLPGALEALRFFHEHGFRVIVASNQAGIARGAMTVDDVERVHAAMRAEAAAAGGAIDAFYYCPHDRDADCECRKPRPGLLFRAQRELSLDLTRTCFLGDDSRDLQAAYAAGARGRLVTASEPLLFHARAIVNAAIAAA
jgi:D-glycero-D-manno-heptose 1,7-bisphosphate phosphatase